MGIIDNIYKNKVKAEEQKKRKAFNTAKEVAQILGERFGAKRVILYGSLARGKYFDRFSDIDLAVEKIGDRFLSAYGYCKNLTEFDIELRDYDNMPAKFKKKIDKQGKVLYERRGKREKRDKNID